MIGRLSRKTALLFLLSLSLAGCRGQDQNWVTYLPAGEGYQPRALDPAPPIPAPPPFLTADLDADGTPETIHLKDGQVQVEEGGQVVWQSTPERRIVDMVAGDAWDDLRQELIMALWQKDAEGVPRSQPFIIGHRHGRYDILWGGSPVADPIYDLDLGDVNGDGRNELVVLEGDYADPPDQPAHFLTVWRWNGWGYTLLWRSEVGRFRDLHLLDIDGDGGVEIVVQDLAASR